MTTRHPSIVVYCRPSRVEPDTAGVDEQAAHVTAWLTEHSVPTNVFVDADRPESDWTRRTVGRASW